jgi:hypothetical protein
MKKIIKETTILYSNMMEVVCLSMGYMTGIPNLEIILRLTLLSWIKQLDLIRVHVIHLKNKGKDDTVINNQMD